MLTVTGEINNSMVQGVPWKVILAVTQQVNKSPFFYGTRVSLPHLKSSWTLS
jgi:hypothetical protein